MTLFSSLGAKRLAVLAITFVIGVACAKVDRGYYDETGGNGGAVAAGSGGKAEGGNGGSSGRVSGDAGSAGESSEAGSAGESAAGAGGAGGAASGTITVTLAGDGSGVVSSDVLGINCGTDCSAEFDLDSEVVLTAKPDNTSIFAGWAGGGCSGTGICKVIVSDATQVKATFTSNKLTVTLAGTGTGNVKSVPAGIDCGTKCSMPVAHDTSVQLTATPAMGSIFSGWSGGGCTGTGVCTTTVAAATTVTATFTLKPVLTVTKAGTGLGTVTSTPTGINCGTECSLPVDTGSMVTLTAAVVGTGSVFTGWSGGGCSGTGTCVVTVTAATQVTATFTCSTGTTTYNYSGTIATFAVPTCVTSLTIDAYGAQGGNAGSFAGGAGARMKGTFAVTGGSSLKVLVGGKGSDATDTTQEAGGSGGGGTFVTTSTNTPLIVAGGGGGGCQHVQTTMAAAGRGGGITTSGLADTGNLCTPATGGAGGLSGSNSGGYHAGTGGGGLLGNGVNNSDGNTASYGPVYTPGLAFINGGTGGQPGICPATLASCLAGRAGGFGGGGAAGMTAGGGGGYSGGCAGTNLTATTPSGGGGGGGSYNNGTAQSNTAATRLGNGMVIFTY